MALSNRDTPNPERTVYVAEKCPCGDAGCSSGNLKPLTFAQGVMDMRDAEQAARELNAYPKLVERLRECADAITIADIERASKKAALLLNNLGERK